MHDQSPKSHLASPNARAAPKAHWSSQDIVTLFLMVGAGLLLLGMSMFAYLFVLGLQGQ